MVELLPGDAPFGTAHLLACSWHPGKCVRATLRLACDAWLLADQTHVRGAVSFTGMPDQACHDRTCAAASLVPKHPGVLAKQENPDRRSPLMSSPTAAGLQCTHHVAPINTSLQPRLKQAFQGQVRVNSFIGRLVPAAGTVSHTCV